MADAQTELCPVAAVTADAVAAAATDAAVVEGNDDLLTKLVVAGNDGRYDGQRVCRLFPNHRLLSPGSPPCSLRLLR